MRVPDKRPGRVELGHLLARHRRRAHLTQEVLARAAFTSRSNLAGIETGRQGSPRDFWQRVDDATHANGARWPPTTPTTPPTTTTPPPRDRQKVPTGSSSGAA
jgi:hypothetical protein